MEQDQIELLENVARDLLYYAMKEDCEKNKLNPQGTAYFMTLQIEHDHDQVKQRLDKLYDLVDDLKNI